MKAQTHEEPEIMAAAERQMHAWAMLAEQEEKSSLHEPGDLATRKAVRFVTISREVGAGGDEIGQRVGQRLGWEVFDKNLLDRIAERFHLPRVMLDLVDETRANWVHDVLGTWMDRQIVPHEKYVAYLTRVVLAAARRGHAVFVGRGVQFLLPRQEVLAIRIISSPKCRIRRLMEERAIEQVAARRYMTAVDADRRQFVERFFHHDINDPHLYDVVINVERCSRMDAVQQILTAMGK